MELMDNEKQKDEVLALQSIYNEEEFNCHTENGSYHCTFKIFLNLPSGYYVTYKDVRYPEKESQKLDIFHLPPLCLYAFLPKDYPSVSIPKFTLCASWLHPYELTKLCRKLDELWEENKGQEILFMWVAFLQDETLNFLNILQCLNMNHAFTRYNIARERTQCSQESKELIDSEKQQPSDSPKTKVQKEVKALDSRAISDSPINVNPIQALINYNSKQAQIEFKRNFFSCKICFSEKLGEDCTQFVPCGHIFCKECISGYLEVRINDGNVMNIHCPEEMCSSETTPGQIKVLVSPELFSKYDSSLLSIALNTMSDIIYCPRPHCQYPVSREPNEEVANCPACLYAFCIHCKSTYHGIEPCKVTAVNELVEEYQTASAHRRKELEHRYGKKQIETLVQNAMSENWINSNSRRCPSCKTAIEKSDGCNKMTCWRCDAFFCWMCNAALNRVRPYFHFEDPKSKCFNMLFGNLPPDEEDEDDGYVFEFL